MFRFVRVLRLCRLQLPVLLVYSAEQSKHLFFGEKARTELNCQEKHPFISVLIITKAVKVNKVTHGQIETWLG